MTLQALQNCTFTVAELVAELNGVALNLFGYATSPVLHTSSSNVSPPPLLPLSIARHVL